MATDYEVFAAGDFVLQSGETLRDARLAYATHGTLNAARSNAVVFPTCYGGTHRDNLYLIGEGRALDPARHFIIVPDMLCNGVSSSPSNTPEPQHGPAFPGITVLDNVALQHRLVTERFGIARLALVIGFSMGAQQSYQWAARYPEMVERIVPICGSAKTSIHNLVFLEGVLAALRADAAWDRGRYTEPPQVGLRAMGRVWAGWGQSQAFYRERVYERLGCATVEEFIVSHWEDSFASQDANDLIAMAWTWQRADIGATPGYGGSVERALAAITARALVMPCTTDLYFPPEDSAYEVRHMRDAELRPIESMWGHGAGGGSNDVDTAFVDAQVRAWLER